MIDVIKRLQELDAQNPNIVKESSVSEPIVAKEDTVEECGMMGSDMNKTHTPATINMTADSGEELADMLKDILSLAGMHKVEPSELGIEPEPAVMRAEPNLGMTSQDGDRDSMRKMLDTLNDGPMDEPQEDWSNSPEKNVMGDMANAALIDPTFQSHEQTGGEEGEKDRNLKNHPVGRPDESTMYETLMADYRNFVSESEEQQSMEEDRISYGTMPADAVRELLTVYQKASQGVEPYKDKEGAAGIKKALDDAAANLGVSKYMHSLYNSAASSAHMDFDTNPGGFENWFNYVGEHLKGLLDNIDKKKDTAVGARDDFFHGDDGRLNRVMGSDGHF